MCFYINIKITFWSSYFLCACVCDCCLVMCLSCVWKFGDLFGASSNWLIRLPWGSVYVNSSFTFSHALFTITFYLSFSFKTTEAIQKCTGTIMCKCWCEKTNSSSEVSGWFIAVAVLPHFPHRCNSFSLCTFSSFTPWTSLPLILKCGM